MKANKENKVSANNSVSNNAKRETLTQRVQRICSELQKQNKKFSYAEILRQESAKVMQENLPTKKGVGGANGIFRSEIFASKDKRDMQAIRRTARKTIESYCTEIVERAAKKLDLTNIAQAFNDYYFAYYTTQNYNVSSIYKINRNDAESVKKGEIIQRALSILVDKKLTLNDN